MASYIQGYDEERFVTTVNQNFLCLICFNVLRDPVMCSRNQHCFCRSCIKQHLQNSQRCPTCNDELTVETLGEPQRMVKDVINELNIHCVYNNRGCQEIVQLQHLDRHEDSCGFTPVVCTNEGCGAIVNKRDLMHHESEQCEYRKLKCHSCGEMSITLANMEKKMQTNMVYLETKIERACQEHDKDILTKMANVETNMTTKIERNIADIKIDMEAKLGAVNNEVKELKTALIECFDQVKEALIKIEYRIIENTRKIRNTTCGGKAKIFVAGGEETDSVEIFNWSQKSWAPLQSMPEKRCGATAFVYSNHVITAGGAYDDDHHNDCLVDNMIRMKIDPNPDLSKHWSDCPVKLPAKLAGHSSVVYNHHLYVAGGCVERLDQVSDHIDKVPLVPPYTVERLSRMPEPRNGHGMEMFDDSLLMVGGSTTENCKDNLSSVVQYDIKKQECKQLAPLPYEVSYMTTVRWGDNIVVIGGADKDGNALDTVIMYIVKKEKSYTLPPMKCRRLGCAAAVIGNNIVVLGGMDERKNRLKSVEFFNFERYHWEELPEMSEERCFHTAVVV